MTKVFYAIKTTAKYRLGAYSKILMRRKVPAEWGKGGRGNVIIFPGFGGVWTYMKPLGEAINKSGYKVHVISHMGPNYYKISKCVNFIEKYILDNKLKNVSLVAHSKGGIVTRYFLVHSKLASTVRVVINISTPNFGSRLGYIGILNAHELTPKSKIIKDINNNQEHLKKVINVYGKHDEMVIPNSSLMLPGARNVKLESEGHLEALYIEPYLTQIVDLLP